MGAPWPTSSSFGRSFVLVPGGGSPDVASCREAQLARFFASVHVLETEDVGLSNAPLLGSSATRRVARRSKSAVLERNFDYYR